jgi:hypothetical protein
MQGDVAQEGPRDGNTLRCGCGSVTPLSQEWPSHQLQVRQSVVLAANTRTDRKFPGKSGAQH